MRANRVISGAWAAMFLVLVAGNSGLLAGCGHCSDACQETYDAFDYCLEPGPGTCLVDGMAVTNCGAGTNDQCVLWNLPAGETLTLPLGAMWSVLGSRDDLTVGLEGGGTLGATTLLFDGVPAQGCDVTPGVIRCENVPRSVKTISFRADQFEASLGMDFSDDECVATHTPCQK